MELAEILHDFERVNGPFPQAAVEAAVARRDEITPELLRVLEQTTERAQELKHNGDYMAHLYAMFLLAQFRETRAYPLIVRFASLPDDLPDTLCGDFLTEGLGRVLASVCGGDLSGIQSLIENAEICAWVRVAGLIALVTLVGSGQKSHEEIVDYFRHLFRGGLVREWSNAWDALVSCAVDLYPEELIDDIRRACAERLVDPGYISIEDVERDLPLGKDRALARLAANRHHRLVEDTVAEMSWWYCFQDHSREREPAKSPAISPVRTTPKVGRNDPCPCGSGRKYKKCCGAPESTARVQ